MDDQPQEPMSTTKKLGFVAGSAVSAAVLCEIAPVLAGESAYWRKKTFDSLKNTKSIFIGH